MTAAIRQRSRIARVFATAISLALLAPVTVLAAPVQEPSSPDPASASNVAPVSVRGIVRNAATGEPLARALVTVNDGNDSRGALTDGEGHFDIAAVPSGTQHFGVRKPGFQDSLGSRSQTPLPHIVRADMSLHAVPAAHRTFHSSGAAREEGEPPDTRVFLKQPVFGDSEFGESRIGFPSSPSAPVEFAVAPGHYTVAQGFPPRISEIDATGTQELDPSAGLPTFPGEVKARMADQSAPPPGLEIVLVSEDDKQQEIKTGLEKMEGKLESVPPGRWNVLAQAKDAVLSIASLQSGAATLSDGRIVVKDRPVSLTVAISAGKTSIEGFAKKDGKGQAGIMIVLVPRAPSTSLTRFRRDQSDSDGSFLLKDISPGNYTAVAIEDGWGLDWARPEVIRGYLAAGTAISITAATGDHLQLETPVQVQPR